MSRSLPPRASCPGRDGGGVGSVFPVLAGQPGGYLSGKFDALRDGERSNDPLALLRICFGAVLRGLAGRCRSPLWPGDPATRAYVSLAAVAVLAATSRGQVPPSYRCWSSLNVSAC